MPSFLEKSYDRGSGGSARYLRDAEFPIFKFSIFKQFLILKFFNSFKSGLAAFSNGYLTKREKKDKIKLVESRKL